MSNPLWRRTFMPFVVASLLAASIGAGTAVAPPPAAAILCTVVNPCYTFAIVMTGIGQATVSATGGISCTINGTVATGTCSARFYANAVITITVEALNETCTTIRGSYTACGDIQDDQETMPKATDNYNVAVDYQQAVSVSVIKGGTGGGHVTSAPYPGIDCGSICTAHQPGSVSTKVQETPDAGSVFAGWGGGCVGTASACIFNTGSGTAISATFNKVAATPPPTLPPTPRPSSSPRPTSTPSNPPPGPTPTPGPGHTTGPTAAPRATPTATVEPGASSADGASPGATEVASSPPATEAATTEPGASATPTDTTSPVSPAGSSGDGGISTVVVVALLVLVVLAGAGGLAIGARMRRQPKG